MQTRLYSIDSKRKRCVLIEDGTDLDEYCLPNQLVSTLPNNSSICYDCFSVDCKEACLYSGNGGYTICQEDCNTGYYVELHNMLCRECPIAHCDICNSTVTLFLLLIFRIVRFVWVLIEFYQIVIVFQAISINHRHQAT